MIPWNQIAICNGKTAAEKHNLCFLVSDKETIINGVYRLKLFAAALFSTNYSACAITAWRSHALHAWVTYLSEAPVIHGCETKACRYQTTSTFNNHHRN